MTFTIKSPRGILDLEVPVVMGIINLTPDSFYAKSKSIDISEIVDRTGQMIKDGAEIIDIGAVSTRPGSSEPTIIEEIDRIGDPIMAIRAAFPEILLSVDTYRSEVLAICLEANINLVNDISGGGFDDTFLEMVANSGLPYVLMHMHGSAENKHKKPKYDDMVMDLLRYFDRKIANCRQIGISEIIIDPGFGFGKSLRDNYLILAQLKSLSIFDFPILVGLSRKSMIHKTLSVSAEKALNGTTALHMLALQNGAKILRVHDVKEAKECINLWQLFSESGKTH